jgi:hypothetical protein
MRGRGRQCAAEHRLPRIALPLPAGLPAEPRPSRPTAPGSSVVYQSTFKLYTTCATPAAGIVVSADQLPLAGGLSSFQTRSFTTGVTPTWTLWSSAADGSQPGDPYLSVQNGLGQEVSRAAYTGAPPGTSMLADGTGFVDVPPGSSLVLTISNVLTPAALTGAANAAFVVRRHEHLQSNRHGGPDGFRPVERGHGVQPGPDGLLRDRAERTSPTMSTMSPLPSAGRPSSTSSGAPVTNAALNIGFRRRRHSAGPSRSRRTSTAITNTPTPRWSVSAEPSRSGRPIPWWWICSTRPWSMSIGIYASPSFGEHHHVAE